MALTEAGSDRAWRTLRQQILQRDGGQCQIRGPHCTGIATTVDHIHPRYLGGRDVASNLRASCKRCNYSRRASPSPASRW